jgi:HPt (histidine-containing phosphotransfer) domain-containing protein
VGENPGSPLAETMNRLWAKYLPQMEERVATLRQAAAHLASGSLTAAERQRASAEAHKLAGVLGTFGLQEGTELAREAERIYANTSAARPADGARLAAIAERLQAMVASRR